MNFAWPNMLTALWLIPLFLLVYLQFQSRRQRAAARYGKFGQLQESGGRRPGFKRHLPAMIFLAGVSILLLSLARPQAVIQLPRIEGTVILAFDVSGSMAADDLQPSRMEVGKAAARTFVEHQPASVRIGVVAFSDGGFAVQAPTNDRDAILASIARLEPQGGTALAHGILAALDTIAADRGETRLPSDPLSAVPVSTPVANGDYAPAAIVLLTDGENNQSPDPLAAAQVAAERGIRVYTIGIGSPAGATLRINEFVVHTRLNEPMLQQISQITDGVYYNAANEQDLRDIYDSLQPQLVIKPEQTEVTSILAGASALVLLMGGVLSLVWFGRWP